MRVRFVLSNNLPSSVTRLTADTASVFARDGIETVVHFPAVDWWDYKQFSLSRRIGSKRVLASVRLTLEALIGWLFRRQWCGFRLHPVNPRVRAEWYFLTPSAALWEEEDVVVVHPPYLLPHLLRTLPNSGVKLMTLLHVNLEKALTFPSADTAAWYAHWVAFHRLLSVPTVVTSEEAKKGAERLGIRTDRLIPGGVDLSLFHPADQPAANAFLTVTLYCDPNPQKGREAGVEAVRSLKRLFPQVRFCSLGHVTPAQAASFDYNHGYLHGEAYARALRESGVFLYPSLYDGFPAPPLQAMASGAALVTTAVEGVTDYVRDGENCLLCQPGDVEGMQAQVARLVQDESLRRRLRQNALRTAQDYSAQRRAAELLEFLKQLTAPTPQGIPVLEGAVP